MPHALGNTRPWCLKVALAFDNFGPWMYIRRKGSKVTGQVQKLCCDMGDRSPVWEFISMEEVNCQKVLVCLINKAEVH